MAFPLNLCLFGEYMGMYIDFRKLDGYQCPCKIVVGRRGLGKTFGKKRKYIEMFVTKGDRFVYVVETGEMVKELTRNNGEKFFSDILEYYSKCDTSRKRYFYNKLSELKIDDDNGENPEDTIFKRTHKAVVTGGTIKINKETAGYIVDINSYAELKRNAFVKVKNIFVDEFISEKMDKTTLDYPRKISSIIQSVARLRKVNIFMAGNAIRFDDPILSRMGFKIDRYGYYKKYVDGYLFAVLWFIDPKDYPDFEKAHNESVAGRFAKMMGETNEEENKFISDLPKNRRLNNFKYRKNGMYFNIVKDDTIITLKELQDGNIACVPFANRGATTLFCMTEKEQGFKLGYHIICNKAMKQTIMDMLRADIIYYYSEVEYAKLKFIIKGD